MPDPSPENGEGCITKGVKLFPESVCGRVIRHGDPEREQPKDCRMLYRARPKPHTAVLCRAQHHPRYQMRASHKSIFQPEGFPALTSSIFTQMTNRSLRDFADCCGVKTLNFAEAFFRICGATFFPCFLCRKLSQLAKLQLHKLVFRSDVGW